MAKDYFSPDKRNFTDLRKSSSCAHKLDYHYVFAVKYRRPVIVGEVEEILRDLAIVICLENGWLLLGLSIQPDHIHVIVGLKPSVAPDCVAHDLKGATSYKVIGAFPHLKSVLNSNKLWGRGYSVETVGRSNVAQINAYLQSQEAHHSEDQIDCS